ncbi:MAG: carboxy terminal-processing peptidase, partial [Cyclobacteriaceae bacterium]|nr:carboxy terminal-processing peptidase [Cyclobacteriaceae bacterium]
KYKSFGVINADLLAELNNHYQLRLQSDPVLNALTKEVGELKESMSKTVISLNEKVRMEERKANEAALLRNQGLSGKVIPEGDDDDKDNVIDVEDKILREGIIILSEIVKHATG